MRPPRFLVGLFAVGLVASGSILGPAALADSTGLADLVLTQSDDPDPAVPGQDVTYWISVANVPGDGTGDATGVSLADSLPAGTTFVAATSPDGTCGAPDGDGVLVCDLGTIAPGDIAGVSVVVTALADGTIENSASVSASEIDPTPADAAAIESTTVHTPTADLSLSSSDDPDPVREGREVTYHVVVSNAGPDTATGVTLTDTLPAGAAFVSANATQGACDPPDVGVVTCALGDVPSSSSASLSITVTAPAPGEMTNTAQVSAVEADPVANNTSSETTQVDARSVDLRVSQVDAPDPAIVGGQVTYTVQIANDGPDAASEVTMTDLLPTGSTFVSASGDGACGSPAAGQLSCDLGSMAPDASAQVQVTVVANAAGPMTNTVNVAAGEDDPDPGDNQATAVTTVQPVPPATPPTSDFDGDGLADLALGVPRRNLPGTKDAGAAVAVYGSAATPDGSSGEVWHEGVAGVAGDPAAGDLEGYALATGDLDDDGFADLAMGAPFEDVAGVSNAGSVMVVFGSASGLVAAGSVEISQGTAGMPGDPAKGVQFGYALAIGDFDGDGVLDLAVGAQREKVAGVARAGAVTVIPGSTSGLLPSSAATVAPGSGKLAPPESGSGFGSSLDAADFDADGHADLAIGLPGADPGGVANAGAVELVRGSAAGLSPSNAKRWTQDSRGVPDAAEGGDAFGSELASGDVDGDGRPDLAIGVPREDLGGGAGDAGLAHVFPGVATGVRGSGSAVWSQDSPGVPGTAAGGDTWANTLAVGDVNGDGFADVVSGARYDDELGPDAAGTANVLLGGAQGLSSAGAQLWSQASAGIGDDPESLDHFGSVLAIGSAGSGNASWLAIGVHFEDAGGLQHAGAAHALPGSVAGPTAAGSQLWFEGDLGAGSATVAFDYFPFALSAH